MTIRKEGRRGCHWTRVLLPFAYDLGGWSNRWRQTDRQTGRQAQAEVTGSQRESCTCHEKSERVDMQTTENVEHTQPTNEASEWRQLWQQTDLCTLPGRATPPQANSECWMLLPPPFWQKLITGSHSADVLQFFCFIYHAIPLPQRQDDCCCRFKFANCL